MSGHTAAVSMGEKKMLTDTSSDVVQSESWEGGSKSGAMANQLSVLLFFFFFGVCVCVCVCVEVIGPCGAV